MNHPSRLLPLLFFLAIGIVPVLGQAPPADKKAQEILSGVSSRYKTYKSVKANFTITVSNPKDKSKTVEKGTLFLKGSKYKLDVAGQEVISDGKTRWTYVRDANEVQIDVQRTDENGITPTNIFTMYEKGWNSRFMGETKEGSRSLLQIELVPVDPKKKNIFKVKLTINKADKSIVSAVMYDKNGSTQSITVDKFLPDGASDESLYVFTAGKYPGAEIIDLR